MELEGVIQIIVYCVVGLASIVSAVIQFVRTGKFEKQVIDAEKAVNSNTVQVNTTHSVLSKTSAATLERVNDISGEISSLRSDVRSLVQRVDGLERRVENLEVKDNATSPSFA